MLLLSLLADTFYFAVYFCCKLFLNYPLPRTHISPLDLLRRSPESIHTLALSGSPLLPRLMGGSQTSSAQTPAAPTSASPLSPPSGPISLPVLPLLAAPCTHAP